MRQQSKESIVILFISAVLALNYPFLHLFDQEWMPLGIPLLYFYLYLLWLAIIVLLIVVVERSEVREPSERGAPEHSMPASAMEHAPRVDAVAKTDGADSVESS